MFNGKNFMRLFVVAAICLFPAYVWITMEPFIFRFESFPIVLKSIGQVTGLVGMTTFTLALILSARWQVLDRWFGGINEAYNAHHNLGVLSFLLLLVHPVALALQFMSQPNAVYRAAKFLLPSGNLSIDFGIYSLLLMMALLVVTFFARFRYTVLKNLHKLLGVALFFGGLHSFFITSDISRNMVIRGYIFSLLGIAVMVYVYRSIFPQFFVKKYKYKVDEVRKISDTVVEITMRPTGKVMPYKAGQFVFIGFKDLGGVVSDEEHPFTISSSPNEKFLSIIVKSLGDYTQTIDELKQNSMAVIEGPFGDFTYHVKKSEQQVWIAGGVGITPFLSMARYFREMKDSRIVDLYYCARDKNDAVYLNEFLEISKECSNFHIRPFLGNERGFLTADIVEKECGELRGKDIFVCGPPTMMQTLKKQFLSLKVQKDKIHMEEFKLL
jgi:predicted ferric reductase